MSKSGYRGKEVVAELKLNKTAGAAIGNKTRKYLGQVVPMKTKNWQVRSMALH